MPGPMPKGQGANSTRNRREAERLRVIVSPPVEPPQLPETMPDGRPWPEQTRQWWQAWTEDPMTEAYRFPDWSDLLDTAVVHGMLWSGDGKAAAELRLRMSRHGATAADRARARIVFATADQMERKIYPATSPASRQRRGGLRPVN
ncbi:hypothetical protein IU421_27675 [Nocardia cyriacigeorgica]|uniref:phage terminase small subunit n=1 Tax=Nocardia cyriacigeorgica TaxID=135487 RepID=UPI0018948CCD|nr:hypothetical protein [Nocardia cyriacigeorgica]MBF6518034.1 hypothetical protein [Nocardia cyriacigeorgica]